MLICCYSLCAVFSNFINLIEFIVVAIIIIIAVVVIVFNDDNEGQLDLVTTPNLLPIKYSNYPTFNDNCGKTCHEHQIIFSI